FTLGTDGSLSFTAGMIPPSITGGPTDQSVECGGSVSLTVTASGDEPLTYQWQRNGVNISGATSSTLSIVNASAANAGSYTVVVGTAAVSPTITLARLLVVDPPPRVGGFRAAMVEPATSSAGAAVAFSATASDICAGSVAAGCTPASGSTFPIGVTTVNCTAN